MYCIFQHNSEGYSSKEPQLPPIAEDRTAVPTWTQVQRYSQTRAEKLQIQQNMSHPLQLLENDRGNCHSQMNIIVLNVCG